jgi:hypothetical protein
MMRPAARSGVAIVTGIYRGLAPDYLDWIGDLVDMIVDGIDQLADGEWSDADDAVLAALIERVTLTTSRGLRDAIAGVKAKRARHGGRHA